MNKNLYWLWLTLKSSLTPVMADKLLEYYKTPEAIYNEKDYSKCGFLSDKSKEELSDKSFDVADKVIKRMNDMPFQVYNTIRNSDNPIKDSLIDLRGNIDIFVEDINKD